VANLLISHGANINAVNGLGMTLLHIVCLNTKAYIVKLLLDRGADVNIIDRDGKVAANYLSRTDWLYVDGNSDQRAYVAHLKELVTRMNHIGNGASIALIPILTSDDSDT